MQSIDRSDGIAGNIGKSAYTSDYYTLMASGIDFYSITEADGKYLKSVTENSIVISVYVYV